MKYKKKNRNREKIYWKPWQHKSVLFQADVETSFAKLLKYKKTKKKRKKKKELYYSFMCSMFLVDLYWISQCPLLCEILFLQQPGQGFFHVL